MRYILFVKETCPFCIKAKNLLDEKGLPYKEVNFNAQQSEILNEIKEAYSWETVPVIFYRDDSRVEFIGGYTDLVKHVDTDAEGR
tara:strand:+ start:516 stop:770 length:255 start_codon:yes stop_codon:yes gene_type:complete